MNQGCQCHLGDILDTYKVFEEEGITGGVWQDGLLPFVSWGCNIFSCIDSHHPDSPVYLIDGDQLFIAEYTLQEMFVAMSNNRFSIDHKSSVR